MKFSLFAHMERTTGDIKQDALYQEFVDLCVMADQGGMHAIWTGEHHGMDFTIAPNPFITLVDLAHRTKNVRLGTGTIVAPFWHPIKLAGEAAMTDIVTNGRLEIGVARGAYSYEYERLMPGMDAWEAGQRMRELVPAVKKLWRGDYEQDGQFHSFPSTSSAPKPLQDGGPAIWVAARDPNSHEFAVENDCNVQVTPLWHGEAEIENLMATFKSACELEGKKPKIMLLHHCYVGADEADLEKAAKDLGQYYCYFGAWFQNKRQVKQGLIAPLSQREIAENTIFGPDIMRKNLAIGTAQQIIDQLKRYEDMGYDEYSFWIDSGMTSDRKKASLRRFIDDVMPAFS